MCLCYVCVSVALTHTKANTGTGMRMHTLIHPTTMLELFYFRIKRAHNSTNITKYNKKRHPKEPRNLMKTILCELICVQRQYAVQMQANEVEKAIF